MNRKILILVVVITVFGFGSATALIVPIGLQTTDNVKLYTKSTQLLPTGGALSLYQDFCDEGDTIINGYIQTPASISLSVEQGWSIVNGLNEGFKILYQINVDATIDGVIVCAKVVQNNIIGGFLLQPDTTALFLAYGIANAVWMAPLAIGVGAGVYLTKTKLKKKVE